MRALFALVALASPALADPTPYDGYYRQSVTDACEIQQAGGGAIKIEDGTFFGAESRCQMENPVDVREMNATLYDMACTSAEAEWQTRAFFGEAAGGGLLIVLDGYAFRYDACSPDGAVGAVTLAPVVGIENGGDALSGEAAESGTGN